MDRFEKELERLDGLTPLELEEWKERMKRLYRCRACSTRAECNARDRELLFCHLGKS